MLPGKCARCTIMKPLSPFVHIIAAFHLSNAGVPSLNTIATVKGRGARALLVRHKQIDHRGNRMKLQPYEASQMRSNVIEICMKSCEETGVRLAGRSVLIVLPEVADARFVRAYVALLSIGQQARAQRQIK